MTFKILICGDSFSADWTKKTGRKGWPNLLAEQFEITNLSQAGCGQYKIFKQLQVCDLAVFSHVIISHTSPYRIHVSQHPIHCGDILHNNCDLIYEDLNAHIDDSVEIKFFVDFFEKYYDLEYAVYVHGLICKDMIAYMDSYQGKIIHLRNIIWDKFYKFADMIDNSDIFLSHRGKTNHFSDEGNNIVYQRVIDRIIA